MPLLSPVEVIVFAVIAPENKLVLFLLAFNFRYVVHGCLFLFVMAASASFLSNSSGLLRRQ
jgi:hypothetical protein